MEFFYHILHVRFLIYFLFTYTYTIIYIYIYKMTNDIEEISEPTTTPTTEVEFYSGNYSTREDIRICQSYLTTSLIMLSH